MLAAATSSWRADYAGALLGPFAQAVLRAGRHRQERPTRPIGGGDLADRPGGGPAPRRAVRDRARDQLHHRRPAPGRAPGTELAAAHLTGKLPSRGERQPLTLRPAPHTPPPPPPTHATKQTNA